MFTVTLVLVVSNGFVLVDLCRYLNCPVNLPVNAGGVGGGVDFKQPSSATANNPGIKKSNLCFIVVNTY